MSQLETSPPERKRPWLQFSLKTFLLLPVFALLAAMAFRQWYLPWAYQQTRIVPTAWDLKSGKNVLWSIPLGSQSYGSPVVSGDKVFVGTNNTNGYLLRYPPTVDLGVLLCVRESDGEFLWQASTEKLPSGRVHDWPLMGICSTPAVAGNRLWYVTNRCELVCLDTEGFHDKENDGPFQKEAVQDPAEADVVWKLDMMKDLGVTPRQMSCSSPVVVGGRVFVVTSNGRGEVANEDASSAPSFLAVDATTGKVLWTDNSPGANVLDGQWGSPTYGVAGGIPQIIFPGGDGWLYSFDPAGGLDGQSKLLWKFDTNAKSSHFTVSAGGTRNHVIASPVFDQNRVYAAGGQNPEFGEGLSCVWCIDATKRGDISAELVFNKADPEHPIPHKRIVACEPDQGDFTRPNPNSAVVWKYENGDFNGNGKIDFEEAFHRSISRIAIQDNLLVVTDDTGILHCLDARIGRQHWTHDLMAATWSSPLIAGNRIYIGDEDGEMAIFNLSADPLVAKGTGGAPVAEVPMNNSIYATPTVANNTLFIVSRDRLFAIKNSGATPAKPGAATTPPAGLPGPPLPAGK